VKRWAAVLGCVLLLSASACSRDEEEPRVSAQPTATIASPTTTPCAVEGATTETRERAGEQFGPVTDVRQTEDGCPRIVYEFKDAVPGYKVAYAEGPFEECGSGAEVNTATWNATAFLDVRLEPSGGPDIEGEGEPYYKGPRDIAVDGAVLKHMKVICDFEGVVQWIVGLDAQHPFDVNTFEGPPRLVIDISGTS
jgi:hypothetical protein